MQIFFGNPFFKPPMETTENWVKTGLFALGIAIKEELIYCKTIYYIIIFNFKFNFGVEFNSHLI